MFLNAPRNRTRSKSNEETGGRASSSGTAGPVRVCVSTNVKISRGRKKDALTWSTFNVAKDTGGSCHVRNPWSMHELAENIHWKDYIKSGNGEINETSN